MTFLLLSTLLAATSGDKQACVAAYDKSQLLRRDHKLVEAKEQLAFCARAECPPLVRNDCTQWMSEVLASTPTVVLAARDARGQDLVDVTVSIDGAKVTARLDGTAFALDPGVHQFRWERTSPPASAELQVVVREGEKNRVVGVTLAESAPPPPAPVAQTPPVTEQTPVPAPAEASPSRHASPWAWVLGGVGIAFGGVALFFDLNASAKAVNLRNTCAPFCSQQDITDVRNGYTVAWLGLGLGVLSIAGATVVYFVSTSHAAQVTLAPLPGGGAAVVSGRF